MDLLILLALIAVNGVFAMSELAVVSSRRARLQFMADKGNVGARAALKLQDDPSSFLSSVQIGITAPNSSRRRPPLPRLAGVTRARYLLLGAKIR